MGNAQLEPLPRTLFIQPRSEHTSQQVSRKPALREHLYRARTFSFNSKRNPKRHHGQQRADAHVAYAAGASAASAFLGVLFFGVAFLGAAFFVPVAFFAAGLEAALAGVLVTRPDLVLLRTLGTSTTAGA